MSAATPAFIPPDLIRARFCHALSDMYRDEVPLYGDLVSLVDEINETGSSLANDDDDDDDQDPVNDHGSSDVGDNDERRRAKADRIQVERHGAIRVGKPSELRMLARLFRLMGMVPVGYYDLSTSGELAVDVSSLSHILLTLPVFLIFLVLLVGYGLHLAPPGAPRRPTPGAQLTKLPQASPSTPPPSVRSPTHPSPGTHSASSPPCYVST
jgi:hypothetical protein